MLSNLWSGDPEVAANFVIPELITFQEYITFSGFGIRDANHIFEIRDSGCKSYSRFESRDANHTFRI